MTTREIPYWLGEQEGWSSCGAAALKYALCTLGFSRTEKDLRRLAQTTWRGTDDAKLHSAARRFGLQVEQRDFEAKQFGPAHDWLVAHVTAGNPVILDVDDWGHYVVAVQAVGDDIVVIDSSGIDMDETWHGDYADVSMWTSAALKKRWLYDDDEGGFSGHALLVPSAFAGRTVPTGPRLRFSEEAIRRYRSGRPWVLDEYLIDCAEIAARAKDAKGPKTSLATMLGDLGSACVVSTAAHWNSATGGDVKLLQAHVRDLQLAAETMGLEVPEAARTRVAVEMTAILMEMLNA